MDRPSIGGEHRIAVTVQEVLPRDHVRPEWSALEDLEGHRAPRLPPQRVLAQGVGGQRQPARHDRLPGDRLAKWRRLGQRHVLGHIGHPPAHRLRRDPAAGQPAGDDAPVPPAGQRQQHVLAGDLGVGEPGRLQVGPLQHDLSTRGQLRARGLVERVAQAVDERLPERLNAGPERFEHGPGGAGAVGVQHPKDQVVQVVPGMIQRGGFLGGKGHHLSDLWRPMGDRWDFGAGEHRIGAGVRGGPCLDTCAWPGPATGDCGLRGWELGVGGGQVQDLPTGDTKQTGGFGGGKKLRGLHHGLFCAYRRTPAGRAT